VDGDILDRLRGLRQAGELADDRRDKRAGAPEMSGCNWCDDGSLGVVVVWRCPGCDEHGDALGCIRCAGWWQKKQSLTCPYCAGLLSWLCYDITTGDQFWMIP
jgi:hypothetical protein